MVDPTAAGASCPRCGAECPAGAARCRACGFALIDAAGRRAFRPRVAIAAAAVVAVVAVAVLLSGGGPPERERIAPPPAFVPAVEAERRLELRFSRAGDDETAAVRCPYRIERRQLVRCELRYADGIARAMLVRLTSRGELEAAVPYPATLRR